MAVEEGAHVLKQHALHQNFVYNSNQKAACVYTEDTTHLTKNFFLHTAR